MRADQDEPGSEARITVLMPVRNAMPFVLDTISVLNSALIAGDQVIVQDCLSSDGTTEALSRLLSGSFDVVHCVEPDAGQSDALNRAFLKRSNDYCLWLNADDLINPDFLARARRSLTSSNADAVYGDYRLIDGAGKEIFSKLAKPPTAKNLMLYGCCVFSGSIIFNAAKVKLSEGDALCDATLDYAMDLDLFLRNSETWAEGVYIPVQAACLRWHSAAKGSNASAGFAREGLRVRIRHARSVGSHALALIGAALQVVSIRTKQIRHSRVYRSARDALR